MDSGAGEYMYSALMYIDNSVHFIDARAGRSLAASAT